MLNIVKNKKVILEIISNIKITETFDNLNLHSL